MIRRIPATEAAGRVEPFPAALPRPSEGARGEAVPASLGPACLDRGRSTDEATRQRAAVARALTLLLSEELRLAPEQIERVLERELARVRCAREIVVHVHPDDLALLRAPDHYARTAAAR
jgi:hypothetical protein